MNLVGTMNNRDEKHINKIVKLMQTDDSVDAPPDSVKWAKNLFRSGVLEPKKSLVRKVLAVLQIDLSPNKPVFGERSAGAQARQMFFEAGENAVDLRIAPNGKNFDVRGQILGEGCENASIRFGAIETSANEFGEFLLKSVASESDELVIRTTDAEIVIENLELN